MQAYLTALADGDSPIPVTPEPPDLAGFVASLASAWRAGEVRPTFSVDAKPRYLRALQRVIRPDAEMTSAEVRVPAPNVRPVTCPAAPVTRPKQVVEKSELVYAERGKASVHALTMAWPYVCRRLEGFPNIPAKQLFEELCTQFPGRFSRWQYKRLAERVKVWRQDARARGVMIDRLKYRCVSGKLRGRRRDPFKEVWPEMLECLEKKPDQTALELLIEFRARYPERYSTRQLSTLQRRVSAWRREAVQRLVNEIRDIPSSMAGPTFPG